MSDDRVTLPSGLSIDAGNCGCLAFVCGVLLLWALLFGVTVDGRHYGLGSCDTQSGLVIHTGKDAGAE